MPHYIKKIYKRTFAVDLPTEYLYKKSPRKISVERYISALNDQLAPGDGKLECLINQNDEESADQYDEFTNVY